MKDLKLLFFILFTLSACDYPLHSIQMFTPENPLIEVPRLIENEKSNKRSTRDDQRLPDGVKLNQFELEIFNLVNIHRSEMGLNKLEWHTQTTIESQDHSQDMASFRVAFGHGGFNNRVNRIKAAESDSIYASGENVAQNSTAKRAFNAWLTSYGHRKNIEGNFTHTGIGARQSANGSWYFTQMFIRK